MKNEVSNSSIEILFKKSSFTFASWAGLSGSAAKFSWAWSWRCLSYLQWVKLPSLTSLFHTSWFSSAEAGEREMFRPRGGQVNGEGEPRGGKNKGPRPRKWVYVSFRIFCGGILSVTNSPIHPNLTDLRGLWLVKLKIYEEPITVGCAMLVAKICSMCIHSTIS